MFSWTTDINLCYESQVSLVTDSTGATLSSTTNIVLTENPTLKDAVTGLVYPILTIDRKIPSYSAIYVRGQTQSSSVFAVLKGFVTVCGNEQITTDDPSNSVFDISLIGDLISDSWTDFDLTAIHSTQSAELPINECPVTSLIVCQDDACVTQYDSNSIRIAGFTLQVNVHIPIRPTTVYLESSTISGNTHIDPILIKVCGYETFTLVDSNPYSVEYEVFRGDQMTETSDFFLNSH